MSEEIKIVEVGPRDGLQNEKKFVPTTVKIDFINALSDSGLRYIEATSFVSPEKIPQTADANAVMAGIERHPHIHYSALVPNLIGFEQALKTKTPEIAVFASATESFSQHNIHCSIEESLTRYQAVIEAAQKHQIPVRGYLSCCFACPYEGKVPINQVITIAKKLYDLGCYEISLGDTLGVATAMQAKNLINILKNEIPIEKLAGHFHDTYGQALTNIYACLEAGLRTFDSSTAGLGGCPYAKGASGNVATEDLLYLLTGLGFSSGIDLMKLIQAGEKICKILGRHNGSKVAIAYVKKMGAA